MKKLQILFIVLVVLPIHWLKASDAYINTEDHPRGTVTTQEYIMDKSISRTALRHLQKEERRYGKLEARFKKMYSSHHAKHHGLGSVSDPVDKWFWIWVFGWGLGILITIISGASIASGFIGILWFSFFIIGSVALIIWMIKKFGKH